MRNVLITGVAGMIGSHLLDALLRDGYRVTGMDSLSVGKMDNIRHNLPNKSFKFIKADILDQKSLKDASNGADMIIHLAARKKIAEDGDALNTLRVNCEGTKNVFEAARKEKIKVIFASTSDVYGVSQDLPFKEGGNLLIGPPTAKRWAYAVSKLYGEQLALTYYKELGVPASVIRYFGCFSPRSSFTWSGGHIPVFIEAVLADREVIIHGDGTQTRSMGYIDDIVYGTMLAMKKPGAAGEIINIGNDEEISVINSAYLIHKVAQTGKRLKIKFIPHRKIFGDYKDIMRRIPDLSKAKKLLGYVPRVSFEEAIKKVIDVRKRKK